MVVGLVPWEGLCVQPPSITMFVQGPRGEIAPIRSVAALKPYLAPLVTTDQAFSYVELLRTFPLPEDTVPGLGPATPHRSGVIENLLREDLRAEGINPEPRIEQDAEGFLLERLVVVRDVGTRCPSYRLVRIRERVAGDGSYGVELLETVRTGRDVGRWIWLPL